MASTREAGLHAPLEWDTPLYRTAIAQFDEAVPHADVHPDIAERLRYPERAVIVSCPVRLDNGRRVVFPGYRVQHSSVLGPTKGGVRYDAEVSLGECAALAVWMTWKCALLRLPYGGAKGGVRCKPRSLSSGELERLTRRFTSELLPIIGPQEDIPAPDMATNEQTMAWMMDTYSMQRGFAVPEIVTGKPISIGGSVFRHEATGAGVVMDGRSCLRTARLEARRPAVRRSGVRKRWRHRGTGARRPRRHRRCRLGHSGGVYDQAGLDIPTMNAYAKEHGSLEGWEPGARITNEELLELECDILVLAAREGQVTAANAHRLQCRLVAEGANGPTSLEGDAILRERGDPCPARHPHERRRRHGVLLRVGAGSGEAVLGRDEIRAKLAEKMNDAFDRVWEISPSADPPTHRGARDGNPRRRRRPRGPRALPVMPARVRDAMIADPRSLPGTASAQEAGDVLSPPEVRAVYVVDEGGALTGVLTRKTLVSKVVAAGLDPRATTIEELAEEPYYTIDADVPLDEAFRYLEEHDAERVPVVEHGRLVGVLSRSVLQRRLAEDDDAAEQSAPPA